MKMHELKQLPDGHWQLVVYDTANAKTADCTFAAEPTPAMVEQMIESMSAARGIGEQAQATQTKSA